MSESLRDVVWKGVHQSYIDIWGESITRRIDSTIDSIVSIGKPIEPAVPDILKPFKACGADDITGILLGQDPYPNGQACGLAFSGKPIIPGGVEYPKVLHTILQEVDRSCNVTVSSDLVAKRIGDLRAWAAQGILMLNALLTTEHGSAKAHIDHWKMLVVDMLAAVCTYKSNKQQKFYVLLWGNEAEQMFNAVEKVDKRIIDARRISRAPHPGARSGQFTGCPSFDFVCRHHLENGLLPFTWDITAPVVVTVTMCFDPNKTPKYLLMVTAGPRVGGWATGYAPTQATYTEEIHPQCGIQITTDAVSRNPVEVLRFGLVRALYQLERSYTYGPTNIVIPSLIGPLLGSPASDFSQMMNVVSQEIQRRGPIQFHQLDNESSHIVAVNSRVEQARVIPEREYQWGLPLIFR